MQDFPLPVLSRPNSSAALLFSRSQKKSRNDNTTNCHSNESGNMRLPPNRHFREDNVNDRTRAEFVINLEHYYNTPVEISPCYTPLPHDAAQFQPYAC